LRRIAVIFFCILAAPMAGAGPIDTRMKDGQDKLKSGDIDAAIATFRDLQVEKPHSPELLYNLGSAQFEQAEQAANDNAADQAVSAFDEAKKSFELARSEAKNHLRRDAGFNAANSLAKKAKNLSKSAGGGEEVLGAFKEAIDAYESHLKQFPNDSAAKTNLDHMRYFLKKMLQNAPPPQQGGESGGDNKEGKQGEKSEDADGDGGQSEKADASQASDKQSEQPKPDATQSEAGNEDEKTEQAQEGKQPKPGDESEDKQPAQLAQRNDEKNEGDGQDGTQQLDATNADDSNQKTARQNIEAILQGLEAQDNQMLKENLRSRSKIVFPKEWW
jgi:Ca-activated chloride channel family protein